MLFNELKLLLIIYVITNSTRMLFTSSSSLYGFQIAFLTISLPIFFNHHFCKIHNSNFDSVDKVMTCKINKNSIAIIFLLLRNCLLVNK